MNGVGLYKETAVATQNRGRLIVLLYDGAIRFLRLALQDMEVRDYVGKGRLIGRAQDIILELNTVLDMESGGEIAQNLRALYNFMSRHLTQANNKCDPQMVREVIALLEDLNGSWRAITS